MHLRAVVPSDAPLVARHRYPNACDAELRGPYAAWVIGAFERDAYLGWLVEIEGKIKAGAGLMLIDWGPTRSSSSPYRGRIVNVFTKADSRGQGMATLLVGRCLEGAWKRGVEQVGLSSTESARSLYSKLGFHTVDSEMTFTFSSKQDAEQATE